MGVLTEPKTCTCYLPSPPSLVLPRPCRWCTTLPSTSLQTRFLSECPGSFQEASKALSDLSDKVTLQQTRRPPRTPHMALHRWGESRSKCTGVPARAQAMMLSPLGLLQHPARRPGSAPLDRVHPV